MKKALITLVIGLLLGSAGFALGVLVGSNRLTGTMSASSPLILSGSPPAAYSVGEVVVFTETVTNTLGSPLNVALDLSLTKEGISASDVSVLIAGNQVNAVCSGTTCDYQGTSFLVNPGDSVLCDISLTFNASGDFAYVLQAWGS